MKTDQLTHQAPGVFLQALIPALTRLKQRLQRNYEQTYPGLGEIIRLVLEEEEIRAWELSPFPHLLLPDLVEAHITNLNLQPVETKREKARPSRRFHEMPIYQPALALCG